MARMHWSVSVERDGEHVVMLSSNGISGRDLSPEDEEAIRTAAQHLLSFIGTVPPPPEQRAGWQPIEAAPKDGTRLLVFDTSWMGGSKPMIALSYWLPYYRNNEPRGNWYGVTKASHWMALPAPPSTQPPSTHAVDPSAQPSGTPPTRDGSS